MNSIIFCHLKLDIVLAIPASNDEKIQLKQFSMTMVKIFYSFSFPDNVSMEAKPPTL